MPLLKGKKNIGKNIKTEMDAGKGRDQALAIALSVAGRSKAKKSIASKQSMRPADKVRNVLAGNTFATDLGKKLKKDMG